MRISRVERSKQAAQAAYDRLSRWYDLFAGSEAAFNRRALEMLEITEGERVLEIGFGTGVSLLELSGLIGATGRAVGIDLSFGMARVAQARLWKSRPGLPVMLNLGDAARLPYATGFFDAVFAAFTLELFDTPEIPGVLEEIRRVLRIGGRLGVVSLSLPERPGMMVRTYEWFHRALPEVVDCRPIPAAAMVQAGGFDIRQVARRHMWGLPVEMVSGIKKREWYTFISVPVPGFSS